MLQLIMSIPYLISTKKYTNNVVDDTLSVQGGGICKLNIYIWAKKKKAKLEGGLKGLYVNLYINMWAKKGKSKTLGGWAFQFCPYL